MDERTGFAFFDDAIDRFGAEAKPVAANLSRAANIAMRYRASLSKLLDSKVGQG